MAELYPIRLYRGNLADLPAAAGSGTPLLAQDVMRLFFGAGAGVAPQPIKVPIDDIIGLLSNGTIRGDLMPPLAINTVVEVADPAARDALVFGGAGDIQTGDFINVLADHDDTAGDPVSQLYLVTSTGGFTPITGGGGGGGIQSVNGEIGPAVVLASDAIDEGITNLYYTDNRVSSYLATVINAAGGIAGLDGAGQLSVDVLPDAALKTGDNANRLGSGATDIGSLLASDGAGGTTWATGIDGGTF